LHVPRPHNFTGTILSESRNECQPTMWLESEMISPAIRNSKLRTGQWNPT
ncbi:hypothetical protein KI387_033711, partial [Taxus chinensis]